MPDQEMIKHAAIMKQLTLEILQAELATLAVDADIAAKIVLTCPRDIVDKRLDEVVTDFNKVYAHTLAIRQL
jgi:hypothetical protein